MKKLEVLFINQTRIGTLRTDNLTAVKILSVTKTNLRSLDIIKLVKLESLYIRDSKIDYIDGRSLKLLVEVLGDRR